MSHLAPTSFIKFDEKNFSPASDKKSIDADYAGFAKFKLSDSF